MHLFQQRQRLVLLTTAQEDAGQQDLDGLALGLHDARQLNQVLGPVQRKGRLGEAVARGAHRPGLAEDGQVIRSLAHQGAAQGGAAG